MTSPDYAQEQVAQIQINSVAVGPLDTNMYLLSDGESAIAIDVGMGGFAVLADFLENNNLTLEKIIATHGHIDHVRDAITAAQAFDVDLYIHPDDEYMLHEPGSTGAQITTLFDVEHMPREYHRIKYLQEGEAFALLSMPVSLYHLPGHSPGCTLLLIESDTEQPILFSGDVLFRDGIGRTDLPGSSPEKMLASLQRIPDLFTPKTFVLPGHGPSTTIERELALNPYLPR